MYIIGQRINIGYYTGFRHQTLVKTNAEVTNIFGDFIKKTRLIR